MDLQAPLPSSSPLRERHSSPPSLPHLSTNMPLNNGFDIPPEMQTPGPPIPIATAESPDQHLGDGAAPAAAAVPFDPRSTDDRYPGAEDSDESDTENDDHDHDGGDDGGSDASAGRSWQPLEEDLAENKEPCEDELKYIEASEEHSALDETYWLNTTLTDVDDPEITVIETGRIDWIIPAYNGTREKPVSADVMRSDVVHIGGYDWQIKFYPHGRRSEYPSVYLENVTMQSPDFEETEDFERPPLPFLECQPKIKKRRSVAAQLSVVLYNPSEPRVHNHRTEAYQFHKKSADIGWKYFTRYPRSLIALRQHGMRKALLADDKLGFRAYIRVIHDPTGCLWDSSQKTADEMTQITGLRPFTKSLPYIAAAIPLLHFSPFRDFIKDLRLSGQFCDYFQNLLFKMFTRRRSAHFGRTGTVVVSDAMEALYRLRAVLLNDSGQDAGTVRKFNELVGDFHPERNYACGFNRLDTKNHPSIQAAVNNHTSLLNTPQLLTLELTRQEHDKELRRWKKITNRVEVPDHLEVSGQDYVFFAFITHCGHLQSARYNTYVRPHGVGQGWYAYHNGRVDRMTEKQARDKHSGVSSLDRHYAALDDGYGSPYAEFHSPDGEVTCAVMYTRNDVGLQSSGVQVETWLPEHLRKEYERVIAHPPNSAAHEWIPEKHGVRGDGDDAAMVLENGTEAARLSELSPRINAAAEAATPEPPELVDGDGDVVMRNTDAASEYEVSDETQINGRGVRDWLGRVFYEGEWKGSDYHGNGHLIETNGDEYTGEFRNGRRHGWGKVIQSSTGDIYEGTWEDSKMHGQGKLVEKSTGNIFEGNFREGRKHGEFVLRGTVTEEDKSTCQICYDNPITTAFYDCGHVLACRECASQVDNCPMCRKRVVVRLQLFGVRVTTS